MKNLFIFDVETDGLYGDAFAVGAVVMDSEGNELDRFCGIAELKEVKNPWVLENVVPHLEGLKPYESREEMRTAFWEFWKRYKDSCHMWADVGCPVESGFIRQCVADNEEGRMWEGPYPLHEVATLLLAKGIDPDISREEFSEYHEGSKHNPVHDSIVSGLCLVKALKKG